MRRTAVKVGLLAVVVTVVMAGCSGVSPQTLRDGGAASGPMTEITLNDVSREKALDRITEVMKSHGFQPDSVNPQLAVYTKNVDSLGSQLTWGRGRTIRISYTITQNNQDVRVSGSITGILSSGRGILTGDLPTQRNVDLMGKEKYVTFLRELLEEIKNKQ